MQRKKVKNKGADQHHTFILQIYTLFLFTREKAIKTCFEDGILSENSGANGHAGVAILAPILAPRVLYLRVSSTA